MGAGGALYRIALEIFQLVDHEHKLQREQGSRFCVWGMDVNDLKGFRVSSHQGQVSDLHSEVVVLEEELVLFSLCSLATGAHDEASENGFRRGLAGEANEGIGCSYHPSA